MSTYDSHVVDAIDNALSDWNTSPDAMRWTTEEQLVPYPRQARLHVDFGAFAEACRQAAAAYQRACELVAAQLADMVRVLTHDRNHRLLHALRDYRGFTRCDRCNPHANPPPLCIDGHAYHQRRKNRRRRR